MAFLSGGVAVVTGAGSAFCAGGNLKHMRERAGMFAGSPYQLRNNYRRGIQRIPLALYELEVPVIAAVNGPAIGAGLDLACMCDIRIAAEGAVFYQRVEDKARSTLFARLFFRRLRRRLRGAARSLFNPEGPVRFDLLALRFCRNKYAAGFLAQLLCDLVRYCARLWIVAEQFLEARLGFRG